MIGQATQYLAHIIARREDQFRRGNVGSIIAVSLHLDKLYSSKWKSL